MFARRDRKCRGRFSAKERLEPDAMLEELQAILRTIKNRISWLSSKLFR